MKEREVLELMRDVVSEADQHVTLRRGLHATLDRRLAALTDAAQADGEEPTTADPHVKRGSYGEPSVDECVQTYIRAYNKKCSAFLHKIDALDSDARAGIEAVRALMIGANMRPYEGALDEIRMVLGLSEHDDHELVIDEINRLRARPAPSPVKVNMLEHANGIEVREVLSDGTDRMVVVVPRDVFIPAPSQALVDVDDVLRTVHAAIASWTHPGMSEHDVWICYDKAIRRALACATLAAAKKEGGA